MIVLRSGHEDIEVSGRRYSVSVGDAVIFPAGQPHEEWGVAGAPLESVHFVFTWDRMPRELPVVFNDQRGRLRALADWMLEERRQPTSFSEDIRQVLLQAVLIECIRLWQCPDEGMVRRIREYVTHSLDQDITLEMLAREANMSRCHFSRRYRTLTGQTPMAEIRMHRLQRARDLIASTAMPLKNVAASVGFTDVYQMCRLFRRHWNITPSSLRRRTR